MKNGWIALPDSANLDWSMEHPLAFTSEAE